MGSLHEGHLSLIRTSLAENPVTAVSIFVNPSQFNEKQDFNNYPRDLSGDLQMMDPMGVDLVFAPSVKEIYPKPDPRKFSFGNLERRMEGAFRPGHFNGVAQVVSRLFEIIGPDRAYFGEKDYQQLAIVRALVKQLGLEVEIIGCPIIREPDGLAMSSRNRLLEPAERSIARRIPDALLLGKEYAGRLPVPELIRLVEEFIAAEYAIQLEYFELADAFDLQPVVEWSEERMIRAFLAAKIGQVRLIDNMIYS
jgi:pantoate--beta-alanine ligase